MLAGWVAVVTHATRRVPSPSGSPSIPRCHVITTSAPTTMTMTYTTPTKTTLVVDESLKLVSTSSAFDTIVTFDFVSVCVSFVHVSLLCSCG